MNPNIKELERPIRFGGGELGEKRHVCGSRTPEEEYELLLPSNTEGLNRGERAFHVVNPRHRAEHVWCLGSVSANVESVEKSGQLQLCDVLRIYRQLSSAALFGRIRSLCRRISFSGRCVNAAPSLSGIASM